MLKKKKIKRMKIILEKKRNLNQIIKEKEEECDKTINNLNKYKKYFKEEMKEIENFQRQTSIIKFDESPYDLEYDEKLTSDRRNSGLLNNIAVYSKVIKVM